MVVSLGVELGPLAETHPPTRPNPPRTSSEMSPGPQGSHPRFANTRPSTNRLVLRLARGRWWEQGWPRSPRPAPRNMAGVEPQNGTLKQGTDIMSCSTCGRFLSATLCDPCLGPRCPGSGECNVPMSPGCLNSLVSLVSFHWGVCVCVCAAYCVFSVRNYSRTHHPTCSRQWWRPWPSCWSYLAWYN